MIRGRECAADNLGSTHRSHASPAQAIELVCHRRFDNEGPLAFQIPPRSSQGRGGLENAITQPRKPAPLRRRIEAELAGSIVGARVRRRPARPPGRFPDPGTGYCRRNRATVRWGSASSLHHDGVHVGRIERTGQTGRRDESVQRGPDRKPSVRALVEVRFWIHLPSPRGSWFLTCTPRSRHSRWPPGNHKRTYNWSTTSDHWVKPSRRW